MPILAFSEELSSPIVALLQPLDTDGLLTVAHLASQSLIDGGVPAAPAKQAIEALQVKAGDLAKGVEAFSEVLLLCSKRNCSGKDFSLSILDFGLSEEQREVLTQAYLTHLPDLRRFLRGMSLKQLHYHDLDWRVDIELATRAQRQLVSPKFVLDLETRDQDGRPQHVVLQSDFATLQEVVAQLEAAVQSVRSKHASRIQRYVK